VPVSAAAAAAAVVCLFAPHQSEVDRVHAGGHGEERGSALHVVPQQPSAVSPSSSRTYDRLVAEALTSLIPTLAYAYVQARPLSRRR